MTKLADLELRAGHHFTDAQVDALPVLAKYFQPVMDWLEAGAPHVKPRANAKTMGFNMIFSYSLVDSRRGTGFETRDYAHSTECGTVCCIGGAVCQFANRRFANLDKTNLIVNDIEMSSLDSMLIAFDGFGGLNDLFYPDMYIGLLNKYCVFDMESVTPEAATQAIVNFFETGSPMWENTDV